MEALFRLMWDAFIGWYASYAEDGEERLVDEDLTKILKEFIESI